MSTPTRTYDTFGWHEGRDPNAFFSTAIYLVGQSGRERRPASIRSTHFDQSGWKEGRVPSLAFDPRAYLAANPDVAAAHVDPLAHFLAVRRRRRAPAVRADRSWSTANGFDYVYYLQHNPDVAAARRRSVRSISRPSAGRKGATRTRCST